MSDSDLSVNEGSVSFAVRVAPRSSRDRLLGLHDRALKIALSAPPVEGAANAALIAFIAKRLRMPKRAVTITRGERGRDKRLEVATPEPHAVAATLRSWAKGG